MPFRRSAGPVLLVEDDEQLREFYRSALAQAGFTVRAVADGLDALRVVEAGPIPTAVVLDLMLPRLSGRDVGQELRADSDTRTIPIIVVTSADTAGIEDIGVDCILTKPVPPERLVEAVDRCVRKRARPGFAAQSHPARTE